MAHSGYEGCLVFLDVGRDGHVRGDVCSGTGWNVLEPVVCVFDQYRGGQRAVPTHNETEKRKTVTRMQEEKSIDTAPVYRWRGNGQEIPT